MIPNSQISTAAPETLIREYTPWIKKIVRKYSSFLERTGAVGTDDLEQIGRIALLAAQQHYDASCGKSFMGYSAYYIQTAIRRELGIDKGTIPEDLKMIYLDAPVSEEDPEAPALVDCIPDPDAVNAPEMLAEEADQQEISEQVRAAVARMKSARQRDYISRIYLKGESVSAIATAEGKTRSAIHSVKAIGLQTLKHDWRLRRFAEPRFHVGVRRFNSTFTSEVEEIVMWRERMSKKQQLRTHIQRSD